MTIKIGIREANDYLRYLAYGQYIQYNKVLIDSKYLFLSD